MAFLIKGNPVIPTPSKRDYLDFIHIKYNIFRDVLCEEDWNVADFSIFGVEINQIDITPTFNFFLNPYNY